MLPTRGGPRRGGRAHPGRTTRTPLTASPFAAPARRAADPESFRTPRRRRSAVSREVRPAERVREIVPADAAPAGGRTGPAEVRVAHVPVGPEARAVPAASEARVRAARVPAARGRVGLEARGPAGPVAHDRVGPMARAVGREAPVARAAEGAHAPPAAGERAKAGRPAADAG